MNVVGITDELRRDAGLHCEEGFRVWVAEAEHGTWGSWEEMEKHYPQASRSREGEAHFPLRSDGTGVRARLHFDFQLILLLYIAPAPVAARFAHRRNDLPSQAPQPKQHPTTHL